MYSKTKRIFIFITAFSCLYLGISGAALAVLDMVYFENTADALKLAIPGAFFALLFILVGIKFLRAPLVKTSETKSLKGAHAGLFFLSFAFALYSFIIVIVFVAIAVGAAIGAALSGNPVLDSGLGNFILTLTLINAFATAVPFVTNIITACIKNKSK